MEQDFFFFDDIELYSNPSHPMSDWLVTEASEISDTWRDEHLWVENGTGSGIVFTCACHGLCKSRVNVFVCTCWTTFVYVCVFVMGMYGLGLVSVCARVFVRVSVCVHDVCRQYVRVLYVCVCVCVCVS